MIFHLTNHPFPTYTSSNLPSFLFIIYPIPFVPSDIFLDKILTQTKTPKPSTQNKL